MQKSRWLGAIEALIVAFKQAAYVWRVFINANSLDDYSLINSAFSGDDSSSLRIAKHGAAMRFLQSRHRYASSHRAIFLGFSFIPLAGYAMVTAITLSEKSLANYTSMVCDLGKSKRSLYKLVCAYNHARKDHVFLT